MAPPLICGPKANIVNYAPRSVAKLAALSDNGLLSLTNWRQSDQFEAGGSVGRPRMLGHFAFSDQSENRGATQGYASEARQRISALLC